jgi:hypothetical protein
MTKPLVHKRLVWLLLLYGALVVLILYPAFHERFGFKFALLDCIPQTLGLIFLATALGKRARHFVTSAIFASDVLCVGMVIHSTRYGSASSDDRLGLCFCSLVVNRHCNYRLRCPVAGDAS